MPITITSVQIGRVLTEGNPETSDATERQWTTAFYKSPVSQSLQMGSLWLAGDTVADVRHHGGLDKAVLCYAASHYRDWNREFPDLKMGPGAFGENLTIAEADETSVCIGDQFQIGECQVEVSQPRQPCWKIARRWGIKMLTKTVAQTGRTGWYIRVQQAGLIQAGQQMLLLNRPHPDWSVARANDVMFGRESDRLAVIELMNLTELADAWRSGIA